MSIVEKTTQTLVRNRVHDITNLTMTVNGSGQAKLKVVVGPSAIVLHLEKTGRYAEMAASLPGDDVSSSKSLSDIEQLIQDAGKWLDAPREWLGVPV